ncbi:phage replisome organizer N-terminal domain-containing protein [Peptostreptococcus anaerobius]|uniref:phage replisome organizer N-terminal domain-containing protein n=1 Tax=Peptostreptococcus anaerobius TaxID=1261 RepID=UPI002804AA5A|nr:phage replisome organizer N-terminal domain-containing protein [uncultured Criibacterium sp.]HEN4571347.1 phage replisome organizer N-terminal domain-containing protein [Streptococcus agalactiae]HEN4572931.1 phage replisome organizer N-terminal domain-containing protein [Streptococcus agalactiae]
MSKNKRYYWLKLKEDFFTDIRMRRLRKISAGGTYTIIYLKLLLLSLRDEGKLYFEKVDETFAKELALVIDETEDDIMITLQYLERVGLIEVIAEDEYFLTELPALIGSETDWASKKRKYREQRKELTGRTMSLNCLPNVRQEIDIEKEIDIELEKEGEIEKDKILPPTPYGEYKNISLTDEEYQKLKDKLQGHTDTMIDKLSRYIESSGKTYKNHYVTILNWYEQDKEKLSQKNNGRTYPTNYEDSDSL